MWVLCTEASQLTAQSMYLPSFFQVVRDEKEAP
jgi:hypothetical protein